MNNLNILVVDDDDTNLEMTAVVLESLGVQADKASSGKEAIAMCGAKKYDVIFMDLEMPEVDGYKTTQAIKSMRQDSSKAIIVALTATIFSKDQVIRCLQYGMKDCIVKPLDAEGVKARFEKWKLI